MYCARLKNVHDLALPPQQLEDDWDGFTSGLEPY